MPFVPKLDQVLELRFYRPAGVSTETIFGRIESRVSEYAPRAGVPTRIERTRITIEKREDVREMLMEASTTDPVRVFDASVGTEYSVTSVDDVNNRKRMLLNCTAFVPAQR